MRKTAVSLGTLIVVVGITLHLDIGLMAQQPSESKETSSKEEPDAEGKPEPKRVSVDVARERAKLAQTLLAASLDVMHDRYFHNGGERAVVPARAMEEVFEHLAKKEHITAKWIAVNATAMSIDHKPKGEFEKQAVRAIASGKPDLELVEDGTYRRAVSISLMHRGCLRCHLQVGSSGRVKRFAGLVVSIPVTEK